MAFLRLPSGYRAALVCLTSLTDESVTKLLSAFKDITPSVFRKDLSEKIASSSVEGISPSDALGLVDALFSLYVVKTSTAKSAEALADDVARAVEGVASEGHSLTKESLDVFQDRLKQLLSVEAVDVCSKATGLQIEYQKIFGNARVQTDVRPVFGNDVSAKPLGFLLLHNLKIEYIESGQQREVFLALTSEDVDDLLEILERAKTKTNTLKQLPSFSGLDIIN